MSKVTVDQIRQRLAEIEQRRRYYEWKSDQPDRLSRHEIWRHDYLSRPYLIGAPDDRVAERFRNIFLNAMEIGEDGKLCPVPLSETDEYIKLFTHLLEEYGSRNKGLPPDDVIVQARIPLHKYFEKGIPIGISMFKDYNIPSNPILVKYGKRQFLESMFLNGDIRLANAGLYNNMNYLEAVRDDETSRTFFLPTYRDRIKGKTYIEFQGKCINFNDDDIILSLNFDDYYLFCLCERVHYRMPTDFDADAAIVIRDPALFKRQLYSAFLNQHPNWIPMEGKVKYYDPYRDYTKFGTPEMAKHFGYAYQKEFRFAFRSRAKNSIPLEPLYFSIGPMTEYADMVHI